MKVPHSDMVSGKFEFIAPQNSIDSNNELQVYLTGYVGETFWQDGIELTRLRNEVENAKPKKVKMFLSTEGGDVKAAFDIVTYMKTQKDITFTVVNAGLVASAGTIILAGGDYAHTYNYGVSMIHKPSMLAWGDTGEMQDAINVLDTFENAIYPIYLERITKNDKLVNGSKEETLVYLKSLMKPKTMTWLSSEEMLELGLVDKIINQQQQSKTIQNHVTNSLTTFKELPQAYKEKLNTIFNNTNSEKDMDFKNIIKAVKNKLGIDLPETADIETIANTINAYEAPKPAIDVENTVKTAVDSKTGELKTSVENLTNQVNEFKTRFETVENRAQAIETENGTLKTKLSDLEVQNTTLSGELATIKGSTPPVAPQNTNAATIVTENQPSVAKVTNGVIKSSVTVASQN